MFSFGELVKIFELVYAQPNIWGGDFAEFDEGVVAANIHHFTFSFK